MNKQIRRLAAGLLVCYLVLFVQLNLLQVVKRNELASNPNNNRAVLRDFDKPRGNIVSAASSQTSEMCAGSCLPIGDCGSIRISM